ncbi:SOS response-associated peptidase [Sulfobacillus thermosulfidooxidans]|uniref:SOS response-associated peptidase n=1 Tax=Sulfobacillus thermosulfidooxidans TaxID=28034 RepID=UPI00048FD7B1|nr:SOS response-associated peptidase [Sulfobacillus thermosulfidooxidans]
MCGRFSATFTWQVLTNRWPIEQDLTPPWSPRFNVAPGQQVLTIGQRMNGQWKAAWVHWGVSVHHSLLINARRESVQNKPLFREGYHHQRVIVPADGFYEWERSTRQPFRFTLDTLFAIAGILIASPARDFWYVVLLTTQADGVIQSIHDRMPWVLTDEQVPVWLGRQSHAYQSLTVVSKSWHVYPVSKKVNNAQNDSPDLILPCPVDGHL